MVYAARPVVPQAFQRLLNRFEIFPPQRLARAAAVFSVLLAGSLTGVSKAQNVLSASADSPAATLPPIDASGVSSSLDGADLPDAPGLQAQTGGDRAPSSKRILGIVPNFRTVSTDEKLPPQTVKQKFVTATQDSFDYSSIFIPAALAGYSLGTNAYPEFGSGGVAYGRYLWHAVADQTSENYLVEAIYPSLTHEDARFYTLGRGGFTKRAGYALSRIVVTRSDAGKQVFNISEVFGSGTSAGLSALYYPTRERSAGNTTKQWGLNLGVDALSFAFKEFWPDVNRKFHGTPSSESH